MMKWLNSLFARLARRKWWDLIVSAVVGGLLTFLPLPVTRWCLTPHDLKTLGTAPKDSERLSALVGLPYVGPLEVRPGSPPANVPSEPPTKRPTLNSGFSRTLYETGSILGLAAALLISGIAIAASLLLSGWSQLTDALYAAYQEGIKADTRNGRIQSSLNEITRGLSEAQERVYVVRFFYRSGIVATMICTGLILVCTLLKWADPADYRVATGLLASACLISLVFLWIIMVTTSLKGVPAKLDLYKTLVVP